MKKLISPIKSKIPQIILIIGFLLIQAYCNLTLPQYTANIVDIGIQNTDFQSCTYNLKYWDERN